MEFKEAAVNLKFREILLSALEHVVSVHPLKIESIIDSNLIAHIREVF